MRLSREQDGGRKTGSVRHKDVVFEKHIFSMCSLDLGWKGIASKSHRPASAEQWEGGAERPRSGLDASARGPTYRRRDRNHGSRHLAQMR